MDGHPLGTGHLDRLGNAAEILRALPDAELRGLIGSSRRLFCPAKTVVFRKGDSGTGAVVVETGRVKIVSTTIDGGEIILNIMNPGDIFGEMALLDRKDRSADAVTMADSSLLLIDAEGFRTALKRNPEACFRVFDILCQRIRNTTEQLEDFATSHRKRLAKRLCRIAETYRLPGAPTRSVRIPFTQRELAAQVGMTREALNRQIGVWKMQGLIEVAEGQLFVTDLDRMRRLVDRV